MTVSETLLWKALRALDLNIRRQVPIGRYVADFAHHGAGLVIEVDGGRHDLPEAQLYDAERDAWLASQGYRVVRIRDVEAFGNPYEVADRVAALIRPKALPLDGGGLGGGVGEARRVDHGSAPTSILSANVSPTPPSPALPPSRGKGDFERPVSPAPPTPTLPPSQGKGERL